MSDTALILADASAARDDVRTRIVAAGAQLLASGGRDALTTRAIAATAGVQAPTLYRLFGDMAGLLDAVAEHVLAAYTAEKSARPPHPDPVQDLRDGWDSHIAFSLANPSVFEILSASRTPSRPSPAAAAGNAVLEQRIRAIALGGLLRVSEARALALVRAAGTGTLMVLLGEPPESRDLGLSALAREAVIAAITATAPVVSQTGPAAAAIALRAALPQSTALSASERQLLGDWLDRIAAARPPGS